jgi:Cys-rich repeat protein/parallel beta-helix repeat protein
MDRLDLRAAVAPLALVAALAGAGCLDINPDDHLYGCTQDSDCPSGQLCDTTVNTCARPGHFSEHDHGMTNPDDIDMAMMHPPGDYPTVTIVSPIATDTTGVNVAIKFEADKDNATFHCRLDGATYADCTSPWQLENLSAGSHTADIYATADTVDGVVASVTWSVDATGPQTTISGSNPHDGDVTKSTTCEFTLTSDKPGATFECRVDGGQFAACASPFKQINFMDGHHLFSARAVANGVTGGYSSVSWTVDTMPPVVDLVNGTPIDNSYISATGTMVNLTFVAHDGDQVAGYDCKQVKDGSVVADWAACTNAMYSVSGDGVYNLVVRAKDRVGQLSPEVTRTFTIDTALPTLSALSGTPAQGSTVNNTSVNLTFTGQDNRGVAGYECQKDGTGAFASCQSPLKYDASGNGAHSVKVRAVDLAGNKSAEQTRSWTVDTSGPVISLTATPKDPTAYRQPFFSFSVTSASGLQSVNCSMDGANTMGCSSLSITWPTELVSGDHTFTIAATDTAGNLATKDFKWHIDDCPVPGHAVCHLTVDPVLGNNGNTGSCTRPLKTIGAAFQQIKAQEVVCAKPGTYNVSSGESFPLTIPNSVYLIGDEANFGGPDGATPTFISGYGPSGSQYAVIASPGSTLAGFSIQTSKTDTATAVQPQGAIIRNNSISNSKYGIFIANTANNQILGNQIYNNGIGIQASCTAGTCVASAGRIEGNTINDHGSQTTRNALGVYLSLLPADLGGGTGANASAGNNIISCNADDLYTTVSITATNNYWDHNPPGTKDVEVSGGAVVTWSPLKAVAPKACP